MKSFNQELKNEIVAEIIRHREQDKIIQGTYGQGEGDNWKGCAVGCAIHSLNVRKGKNLLVSNHKVYEDEFGIPRILAKLEDTIFEGLSVENSKSWPENFMSAIPVESDLFLVWPKFAIWLLIDGEYGVIKYAKNKEVISDIADLYKAVLSRKTVDKIKWELAHKNAAYAAAAAYAAYDAAADAAYAAAYADDAAAADNAAYAAYDAAAAAYAAYAAAYAAADDAAYAAAYAAYAAAYDVKKSYYKACSEKLIEILKECK